MPDLITAATDVAMTARTSIVHKDDSRTATSTLALFRREKVLTPAGDIDVVPIISGNAWRGVLRRIGEQLLAPVLDYHGQLSTPAAHLLRNGGTLRKTTAAFTAEDERRLATLVPLIGLFGGAANGRVMRGALTVSKVVPVTAATAHLLPTSHTIDYPIPASPQSVLGLESFTHADDTATGHHLSDAGDVDPRLRYDTETLIAGTRLHGHTRIAHASALSYAFYLDILDTFTRTGHLGARSATGHGTITAHAATTITAGTPEPIDWRAHIAAHRDDAMAMLATIT